MSFPQPPGNSVSGKSPRGKRLVGGAVAADSGTPIGQKLSFKPQNEPADTHNTDQSMNNDNNTIFLLNLLEKARHERELHVSQIQQLEAENEVLLENLEKETKKAHFLEAGYRQQLQKIRSGFEDRVRKQRNAMLKRNACIVEMAMFLTSLTVNYPDIPAQEILQKAGKLVPAAKEECARLNRSLDLAQQSTTSSLMQQLQNIDLSSVTKTVKAALGSHSTSRESRGKDNKLSSLEAGNESDESFEDKADRFVASFENVESKTMEDGETGGESQTESERGEEEQPLEENGEHSETELGNSSLVSSSGGGPVSVTARLENIQFDALQEGDEEGGEGGGGQEGEETSYADRQAKLLRREARRRRRQEKAEQALLQQQRQQQQQQSEQVDGGSGNVAKKSKKKKSKLPAPAAPEESLEVGSKGRDTGSLSGNGGVRKNLTQYEKLKIMQEMIAANGPDSSMLEDQGAASAVAKPPQKRDSHGDLNERENKEGAPGQYWWDYVVDGNLEK